VVYDIAGPDPAYRSLWLRPDAGSAGALAAEGSGVLLVEAPLRRIVHPPIRGADGSNLSGLVAYRLTGADVAGAVTAQDATPRRKQPSVPGPVASTPATEQQAVPPSGGQDADELPPSPHKLKTRRTHRPKGS
jgi:hypothetical protein